MTMYVRRITVGLSVVAAAGNEGGAVQAPADLPEVLGVGASDANPSNLGVMCPFSNSGPGLALFARAAAARPKPTAAATASKSRSATPANPLGRTAPARGRARLRHRGKHARILTDARLLPGAGVHHLDAHQRSQPQRRRGLQCVRAGTDRQRRHGRLPAQRTARRRPPQPNSRAAGSDTHPPAKPASAKPKIVKITFKHHRLTITVATVPKGMRLRLLVQVKSRRRPVRHARARHHSAQDDHAARKQMGSDRGQIPRRSQRTSGGARQPRHAQPARRCPQQDCAMRRTLLVGAAMLCGAACSRRDRLSAAATR